MSLTERYYRNKVATMSSNERTVFPFLCYPQIPHDLCFLRHSFSVLDTATNRSPSCMNPTPQVNQSKWTPLSAKMLLSEQTYLVEIRATASCDCQFYWTLLQSLIKSTPLAQELCQDEHLALQMKGIMESFDFPLNFFFCPFFYLRAAFGMHGLDFCDTTVSLLTILSSLQSHSSPSTHHNCGFYYVCEGEGMCK